MKWVKRGCWLAAWGVWGWLGLGLYRELPRHFQVVATLPTPPRVPRYAFVGDSHEIAVAAVETGARRSRTVIRIFDADSGEKLRELTSPGLLASHGGDELRQGVAFVNEWGGIENEDGSGLFIVDLFSGKRHKASSKRAKEVHVHESLPLVSFREEDSFFSSRLDRLVVFDWAREEEVFSRERDDGIAAIDAEAVFLPKSSRIVVPTRLKSRDEAQWPWGRLEIWDLATQPALVGTLKGSLGVRANVSANGRIVFLESEKGPSTIDVYDLATERRIFTHPSWEERRSSTEEFPYRPILMDEGRLVFGGPSASIFDLASKQVVWPRYQHERVMPFPTPELFCVWEPWHQALNLPFKTDTFAIRNAKGRLLFRTWTDVSLNPAYRSSDGRLLVNPKTNEVVRAFPRADHRLLALCQAILALPLILLWVVLRWRRHRRLRLASVTP